MRKILTVCNIECISDHKRAVDIHLHSTMLHNTPNKLNSKESGHHNQLHHTSNQTCIYLYRKAVKLHNKLQHYAIKQGEKIMKSNTLKKTKQNKKH